MHLVKLTGKYPFLTDWVNTTTVYRGNNGQTNPISRNRGMPQGCALSSLLFILTMNTLLDSLNVTTEGQNNIMQADRPAHAYANDLSLRTIGLGNAHRLHRSVMNYCKITGYPISIAKCRVQTSGLRKVFLLNDNANDDDKEPIPMLGRNDCIKYLKELMTDSISKVKKLVTALSFPFWPISYPL